MNRTAVITLTAVVAAGLGYYAGNSDQGSDAINGQESAVKATSVAPVPEHEPLPGSQVSPVGKFTHFRVGDRNVKSILADGDVVWVGTSGGVIRYDTKTDQYKLFDNTSGLLANGVFHLSKLNGRLLVGTYGGGMSLMKPDGNGWDTYNIPQGLADAFVYDVLEAQNGDIWVATWSGANRIVGGDLDNADAWKTYTVANTNGGLPNDWVYAMRKGAHGEIWMATEGGLTRYLDGVWDNWQHEDGLGANYELVKSQITFLTDPAKYSKHHARQKEEMKLQDVDIAYNPNYIVALEVDRNGIVWAGTWGGGLARFDGKNWKNYTVSDGLPANHVFTLREDENGALWVGTSAGIAKMEGEEFKLFSRRDGLFADSVFSMAKDAAGRYWVGSYGGVARIDELK